MSNFKAPHIKYCPLTLAYIGDAVMEIWVRKHLIQGGDKNLGSLNKSALKYVSAVAQSAAAQRLQTFLTPEELIIYKRGRNTSAKTIPKTATVFEYRRATGLEALLGWLWLLEQFARVDELLSLAFPEDNLSI